MNIYDTDWPDEEAVETGELTSNRARLLFAMMEAGESGAGEVVVTEGAKVAKIHFHDDKIAWVARSDEPHGFVDHLVKLGMGDRKELARLLASCLAERRSFTEGLAATGLVDAREIRVALVDFLSRSLGDILRWPTPEVVFAPWPRSYEGRDLFPARDLILAAIDLCHDHFDPDELSGIRRIGDSFPSCLES